MMTRQDPRPLWLVHAELPPPLIHEAWVVEAKALGFTDDIQIGHLMFYRWLAHIDPSRVERWAPQEQSE